MQKATYMRLRRVGVGILGLGVLTLILETSGVFPRLEQSMLDFRYAHFNRDRRASNQVVVIDIDEQSMKLLGSHYGRWPWPRKVYKDLLEFFAVGEPAGIFFDLLFTEPSLNTGDDQILSESSVQTGLASHAMQLLQDRATEGTGLPELPSEITHQYSVHWNGSAPERGFSKKSYKDFSVPIDLYLKKGPRVHVVTVHQENDGVYRRLPLVFQYGSNWLPSLSLNAILSTLPDKNLLGWKDSFLIVGKKQIPLESDGQFRIHFYQVDRGPEVISFSAVMFAAAQLQKGEVQDPSQLKVNPFDFKDKVILIGGSAAGLEDLKITPVSPAFPGVLLHASAISNILENDFLLPCAPVVQIGFTILTLVLVYGFSLLTQNNILRFLFPLFWLLGTECIGLYLFKFHSIWFELARPLGLGIIAWVDSLSYLFFIENREKRKMKESLSKYVPPALADEIIRSGEDPRAEVGRVQDLSVLFSDIRGFTALSEKLEPKVLVELLNEYLSKMTDVVFDFRGTLDKFMGDAVMAFWGAPVAEPNHAILAVRCALKMRSALKDLNQQWIHRGLFPIEIGIGINSGPVIVGNIGSEKRLDYTVIGDNVNLASRLEGLTKQYKVGILISEKTQELIKNSVVCRQVDFVRVKGKIQCVKIYEVIGEVDDLHVAEQREYVERFEEALNDYQTAKFSIALEKFEKMSSHLSLQGRSDLLTQVYIERCQALVKNPPLEWDGVYVATSK